MLTLVYCDGDGSDRRIQIGDKPVVVGRAADCDIRSQDPQVSRHHARLFSRDGELWIEDLKSANGVFVGTEKTELRTVPPGELVVVGSMVFQLSATPGQPAPPPSFGAHTKLWLWLRQERRARARAERVRDQLSRRVSELTRELEQARETEHTTKKSTQDKTVVGSRRNVKLITDDEAKTNTQPLNDSRALQALEHLREENAKLYEEIELLRELNTQTGDRRLAVTHDEDVFFGAGSGIGNIDASDDANVLRARVDELLTERDSLRAQLASQGIGAGAQPDDLALPFEEPDTDVELKAFVAQPEDEDDANSENWRGVIKKLRRQNEALAQELTELRGDELALAEQDMHRRQELERVKRRVGELGVEVATLQAQNKRLQDMVELADADLALDTADPNTSDSTIFAAQAAARESVGRPFDEVLDELAGHTEELTPVENLSPSLSQGIIETIRDVSDTLASLRTNIRTACDEAFAMPKTVSSELIAGLLQQAADELEVCRARTKELSDRFGIA